MTDQTPMPYGKYQGQLMGNVPAKYLLWLHENDKCTHPVKKYIEENMDALRKEEEQPDRICGNCANLREGVWGFEKRLMCGIQNRPTEWRRLACENFE